MNEAPVPCALPPSCASHEKSHSLAPGADTQRTRSHVYSRRRIEFKPQRHKMTICRSDMASEQLKHTQNGLETKPAEPEYLDPNSSSVPSKVKRKAKKVSGVVFLPYSASFVSAGLQCLVLRGTQNKKAFLPLPTLEAVQQSLPWHINFSQKLGRHAIATQDIPAGQCILSEDAVSAIPSHSHQTLSCHNCLTPLPEGDALQLSQGVILDKPSKHYKRYCNQSCCHADSTASSTAGVHAKISQIAAQSNCDSTLLHLIVELDAQRPQQSAHQDCQQEITDPDATQAAAGAAGNTRAVQSAPVDVIICTLADVEALLAPFDRNQKGWREAITAGDCIVEAISCLLCENVAA